MTFQDRIDEQLQTYYSTGQEARRLHRSLGGRLEYDRTQEIIRAAVAPGSRIADVGGADGVHAAPLAAAGYEVVLVDPVPFQVEAAKRHGTFDALVGDARSLPFDDDSFDACLLLGPLYHLQARDDRVAALREAARVTKPGGVVIAAAITRISAFLDSYYGRAEGGEEPWAPEDAEGLAHGWIDAPDVPFPFGHFHTGGELEREVLDAGLTDAVVHGVEGPGGLTMEWYPRDHPSYDAMISLAREYSTHPGLREAGPHLLTVARVPGGETRQ